MLVQLTEFLPYVLPKVPVCSPEVALQAIREKTILFCKKTHAWKETINITPQANVTEYPIMTPYDTNPICIYEVRIGDYKFFPSGKFPMRCSLDQQTYTLPDYDRVMLDSVPCCPCNDIIIYTAVAPKQDACGVSEEMYELYAPDIAYGALADLHTLPELFNPQVSGYYQTMFNRGVGEARNKNFYHNSYTSRTIKSEYF